MSRKVAIWILRGAWVAVLGSSIVWILAWSHNDQFCTLEGYLEIGGYYARDQENNCAMTFFPNDGESYVTHSSPFSGPAEPAEPARTAAAAWTLRLLIVAIGVSIWFVVTQGRERPGENPPPDNGGPDGPEPGA